MAVELGPHTIIMSVLCGLYEPFERRIKRMIVLAPIKLALIYLFLVQYMYTLYRNWIELAGVWVGLDWIEFDFVCAEQRAISVWPLTVRVTTSHSCVPIKFNARPRSNS